MDNHEEEGNTKYVRVEEASEKKTPERKASKKEDPDCCSDTCCLSFALLLHILTSRN